MMLDSLIMGQAANAGIAPDMNESFLPRILSIFYATFDLTQGPKIMYQVPEDSISVAPPPPLTGGSVSAAMRSPSLIFTPSSFTSSSSSKWAAPLDEPEPFALNQSLHSSPSGSQVNLASPGLRADKTANSSPFMYPNSLAGGGISRSRPMGGTPAGRSPLLDFESISEYVIPKTELCGRLVHCNTPKHRILGFPVVLEGDKYDRNAFRYNLCFVFDRKADLSCYEPVVRKCARVLLSCEEESGFLSNPETSGKMYQILEQLYEDLNSYSETSLRIDSFNSIELRIFPFYPNPPKVKDWQVPVALINLQKRMDSSWDLTMVKVCPHINGVNHVRKIADLADVDPLLARKCMEHLLFYQSILMVDIFQYSNMYTLKPAIQWLAEDSSVLNECAAYVTRPGHPLPSWPTLLQLYSRLKPGKTLHEWIEETRISSLGIDVRRFVSFGIIKGYLRRVHRWPILVQRDRGPKRRKPVQAPLGRTISAEKMDALLGAMKEYGIGSAYPFGGPPVSYSGPRVSESLDSGSSLATVHGPYRHGSGGASSLLVRRGSGTVRQDMESAISPTSETGTTPTHVYHRARQNSIPSIISAVNTEHVYQPYGAVTASITAAAPDSRTSGVAELSSGQQSAYFPASSSWKGTGIVPPTPTIATQGRSRNTSMSRPNTSTSGGTAGPLANIYELDMRSGALPPASSLPYPEGLPGLLDGNHHSDELCTLFGVGWPELEEYLYAIGRSTVPGGEGDAGDHLGKVKIIYR